MKRQVIFIAAILLLVANSVVALQVDEGLFVEIGGIRQWVTISGDKADAPVLLFLHGGPGNPPVGESLATLNVLRKKFLLVVWHQRESGRTFAENKSPQPLSPDLLTQDAEKLILWLKNRFDRNKVMLMGHSWGGYLAIRLAATRPDLVAACIAISPMIHQDESERQALDSLKHWAAKSNSQALSELNQIRLPIQDSRSLFLQRKWMAVHSKTKQTEEKFVVEWSERWLKVFMTASATDFRKAYPVIPCPVAFLIGKRDLQTHFSVAESYYQMVQSPDKKWFWFNRSGHGPHRSEPEQFLKITSFLADAWSGLN